MADFSIFGANVLTGGGDGALDTIDGNGLDDGDMALVIDNTNNKFYVYTLNSSIGGTESSPELIEPNLNAGTKRWELCDIIGFDGTSQHDLSDKPDRVAAPVADNLVDMDANGDLTDSGLQVSNTPQIDVATEWTAQQNFDEQSITSTTNSVAWDLDDEQAAVHTMTENTTIASPSNMNAGGTYTLRIVQAAGPYTLAWNAAFLWGTASAPTAPAASGDVIICSFYSDGTNMYGVESIREEA